MFIHTSLAFSAIEMKTCFLHIQIQMVTPLGTFFWLFYKKGKARVKQLPLELLMFTCTSRKGLVKP